MGCWRNGWCPRPRSRRSRWRRKQLSREPDMTRMSISIAAGALLLGLAPAAGAATLEKVRDAGKITIGYNQEARPFAFAEGGGKPVGYAITVCDKVVDALKADLKLQALAAEYVPLAPADAVKAVEQGRVDL